MEPVIVPRSDHPISRKSIDPDAVKVLYRLHRAGYQAYLVGGGVRDLLLGRNPKDFDISTDAHPHQVKRLFRNCRLIGRRFRLAHVHFGGKIVEVSTFRKRSEPVPEDALPDGEEEDILIRSDNTFGTAEEDALRRDFTINGLFYDIGSFAVIDYVDGLEDLKTRTIRTIGDPDVRFREDPVRMIRAIKFAARLDFDIEPATWQAILDNHDEILKSAPPRVLEEVYRLLGSGAAARSFHLLEESGMLDILVPQLTEYLAAPEASDEDTGDDEAVDAEAAPMHRWLTALDKLRNEDAPLTNALLIGALVGPMAFDATIPPDRPAGESGDAAGEDEGDDAEFYLPPETEDRIRDVLATLGVPRRDTERLFQTFRAMRRFSGQRSRRFSPRSFVTKNYFPEAFLFLHLVIEATGRSEDVLTRWRKLAEEAGLDGTIPTGSRRRRRRRRRRGGEDGRAAWDGPPAGDEFDDAPEDGEPVELADSPAESNGTEEAPIPAPRAAAPGGRERRFRSDAGPPPEPAARPAPRPAAPRAEDDEDEDSQIRFLGWSDQPEILRDRPEPPPIVNPYTRQAPGSGRRGGFRRQDGGAPRHGGPGGGGRSGGYGGGQRSGGPRDQGPRQGGGSSGGRYGGPSRGEGGEPRGRGNWGSGRSWSGGNSGGQGGQGGQGGYGRGPGGSDVGRSEGPRGSGGSGGQSGRRPRRRQRRRHD